LDICLESIVAQLDGSFSSRVEVIIVDNNSSDDTEFVAAKYLKLGHDIVYVKNSTNIGLDGNLTKAFDLASGKYVQIIGDDDYWIEGKLKKAMKLMDSNDFGVFYAKAFAFKDFDEQLPKDDNLGFKFYTKPNLFLYNINILITFTSSSIINKDLVKKDSHFKLEQFLGTELNLLNWVFTACLNSKCNIITNEHFIAAKTDNSSGYKLFQVFGLHFNSIMTFFKTKGLSQSVIEKNNFELTTSFFPHYINQARGSGFTYNDRDEEIYSFLKGYRNEDFLSRMFLLSSYNKKQHFLISFFKKIILAYSRIKTKLKNGLGMVSGNIYKKDLT